MKFFSKIKSVFLWGGTFFLMLPTKIFAASRDVSVLYGPPEDYVRNTTNTASNTIKSTVSNVSESSASFELDSLFLIRCLTFFLVPLIFIIGLIIFAKKSKSEKSTKVFVSVFLILLIVLMVTGATLFVVGSILGWF